MKEIFNFKSEFYNDTLTMLTVSNAIKELGLVLLQYQIVNKSIILILCFEKILIGKYKCCK